MIAAVPYLIDGNNLIFACKKVGLDTGREGLCRLLGLLVQAGERVAVVFDGPAPSAPLAEQIAGDIEVIYAGPDPADELIYQWIAENTAPRRLTVVSTDRQIRRAARRRRCRIIRSDDFAMFLIRLAEAPPKPPPTEPPEKRRGLSPEQTAKWLEEFGIDTDDEGPDQSRS